MIKEVNNLADIIHKNRREISYLLSNEANKTIRDADSEVREAIDFCRFYAGEAWKLQPEHHVSISGENSVTYYEPRGRWLTINPWNFPLAILVDRKSVV